MRNVDKPTVRGFGQIWSTHDDPYLRPVDERDFASWFSLFPLNELRQAEGFELGCGSGRWAAAVARHVRRIHCIDPAPEALAAAKARLAGRDNIEFHLAAVDSIPLADGSQDFGYSLGVLHHLPDPEAALRRCVAKLRPGAPFLLYLYYAFDNRPRWFVALWKLSDLARRLISRLPFPARRAACDLVAASVYFPLSRIAGLLERGGVDVDRFPLSYYRRRDFRTLRAGALDRLGTRLEWRFSRAGIEAMMARCGLGGIRFLEGPPYWIACGRARGDARDAAAEAAPSS